MRTRPNGLVVPAQPVTERDPHSVMAKVEREVEMAMRAEELRAGRIEYAPAATPKQLDQIRMEIELNRQARNRNFRGRR